MVKAKVHLDAEGAEVPRSSGAISQGLNGGVFVAAARGGSAEIEIKKKILKGGETAQNKDSSWKTGISCAGAFLHREEKEEEKTLPKYPSISTIEGYPPLAKSPEERKTD